MKKALVLFFHMLIWFLLMVGTVFICAFIEYDFNLSPNEKSKNLAIYYLVGAFVYPLIRFVLNSSRPKTDSDGHLSEILDQEKESARLARNEKLEREKLKLEEDIVRRQRNYQEIFNAHRQSKISKGSILSNLKKQDSKISEIENTISELDNKLSLIKERHPLLPQILGSNEMLKRYNQQLKISKKSSKEINEQLI